MGGIIISNCAIPGMSVADEDADLLHHGSGLDHTFRSHPTVASAQIKSGFLRYAIGELTEVSGAISARVSVRVSDVLMRIAIVTLSGMLSGQ